MGNTGRDKHVNEKEVRNGDLREENPNVKGEKAPNVRTDRVGTSDVPATEQTDLSPKSGKNHEDRDPSR